MSHPMKLAAIGVGAAYAGSMVGGYLAPKVTSVPAWAITLGSQFAVMLVAFKYLGHAK